MDLNKALSDLDITIEYSIPNLPDEFLNFSSLDHNDDEIEDIVPFCPLQINAPSKQTILNAEKLSTGNDVKEIYAVELSNECKSFQPGDTIGIIVENRDDDVKALFAHLGITSRANEKVKVVTQCKKKHNDVEFVDKVTTLNHIFKTCVDLNCTPRKILIRVLAHYTSDKLEKKFLEKLCSKEESQFYTDFILNTRITFLELILMFRTCQPPLVRLIENLPKLLPRPYSIASSPLASPQKIKIVFSVIKTGHKCQEGLCTGMLKKIINDSDDAKKEVKMYFRKSQGFNLPDDEVPLILIGPGTGIAPFIGFLQHRKMQKKSGKIWLFYGCRYKTRDFLFKRDLEKFLESQTLTKLSVAFSRENLNGSSKYVQDNLKIHGKDLTELIENEGARIYVCGDARNMRIDVFNCFAEIIERHKGMTNKDAISYLKQLQKDKRYLQDIWL